MRGLCPLGFKPSCLSGGVRRQWPPLCSFRPPRSPAIVQRNALGFKPPDWQPAQRCACETPRGPLRSVQVRRSRPGPVSSPCGRQPPMGTRSTATEKRGRFTRVATVLTRDPSCEVLCLMNREIRCEQLAWHSVREGRRCRLRARSRAWQQMPPSTGRWRSTPPQTERTTRSGV